MESFSKPCNTFIRTIQTETFDQFIEFVKTQPDTTGVDMDKLKGLHELFLTSVFPQSPTKRTTKASKKQFDDKDKEKESVAKEKKPRKQKDGPRSAYNDYISKQMSLIKEEYPEIDSRKRMTMATERWNKQKSEKTEAVVSIIKTETSTN